MNKHIQRQQMLSLLQQTKNLETSIDMKKLHEEMMTTFGISEFHLGSLPSKGRAAFERALKKIKETENEHL